MYNLRRKGDGAGCTGKHSNAVQINQPEAPNEIISERPTVGCSMVVIQGMYTWWQTTEITEILEDTEKYVRFKTLNSEYEWTITE